MKHALLLLCLISILIFAGCGEPASQAPPEPVDTSAADAEAVRAQTDNFLTWWNAGDADSFNQMYTDDAVQMQPDGPNIEGREAIVQAFADYFNEFGAQQTANVEDVEVFGDSAYARGSWSLTQTPKSGGDEQSRSGKWLTISDRQADGSWKVSIWMWNENRATE